MQYLHTMVRVTDLDASIDFFCNKLGLVEQRRVDVEAGRFMPRMRDVVFSLDDFNRDIDGTNAKLEEALYAG